jgi:hypothetical protein
MNKNKPQETTKEGHRKPQGWQAAQYGNSEAETSKV